jgi:hypothetical protein
MTDLTNYGQVFNALTTHSNMSEYETPHPPKAPDVAIHFGAYARSVRVPDIYICCY